MKKIIMSIIAITLPLTLCSNSTKKGEWIDNSTFRVSGTGFTKKSVSMVQRRAMACEAARLDAVSKLIIRFAETGIESVKGSIKTEIFKDIIRKEFSGVIKGATKVNSTFDNGSGSCVVIYEIHEKDMKKKIIRLADRQGK